MSNTDTLVNKPKFGIGDKVEKAVGDYHPTGEIRAVFTNKAGGIRYVMEFDLIPGMLHIFSEHQLAFKPSNSNYV